MDNKTKVQEGYSVLRPRARIIKTLGEELISNDIVAILELVKNSYDANADIISINFEGTVEEEVVGKGKNKKTIKVLKKEGGLISIEDDGIGMSLKTVKEAWMEPATPMKKYIKQSQGKLKTRRHTGEKGIGRFASAKLSSKLNLITKEFNDNEIVADFDWNKFSDDEYLDNIKCFWKVQEPTLIKKGGTILKLVDLKSDWDEEKIKQLRVTLSRLINPLSPITDFLIELNFPKELELFSGVIDPPDTLTTPMYSIDGRYENGKIICSYNSVNLEDKEEFEFDLAPRLRPIRYVETGHFSFKLFAWDRDIQLKVHAKTINSTVKEVKRDLSALSGISIYRDDFRVLPYGEPKNDWLRLDLRRVQNPTLRMSNNQIIGYIGLNLDNNPEFTDQSNREGIVESTAFNDLEEIIKVVLNELEQRRYRERRMDFEEGTTAPKSLFSSFSVSTHFEKIQKKYPKDEDITATLRATERTIKVGLNKVQEVLSRYRRLSTLGMLVDAILHDSHDYLGSIDNDVYFLEKALSKPAINKDSIKKYSTKIIENKNRLRELFRRLEPFGGRKRGRPKKMCIEKAIENVFELKKNALDNLGIVYTIPTTESFVTIDEGEFQSVILNLLGNSIYWLETIDNEKRVIVDIVKDDGVIEIIFSDNGPGIIEENRQTIFDPYFSTKPEGIGLGLTIIGETIAQYGGQLLLINNGPLDGATFKITFEKRV